ITKSSVYSSSDWTRMAGGKPCRVCNYTRQKSIGLAVPSIDELKIKGKFCFLICSIRVVLEEDGTIVEDQAYFLCLPLNTKFIMLCNLAVNFLQYNVMDGGTAWMARDSVLMDADEVDAAVFPWVSLAQRLKEDMASVILMAEADLQMLIDVPHTELASALGYDEKKTKDLQGTLQGYLDRKEEERQSKELLQLYFKTINQGQDTENPGNSISLQPIQYSSESSAADLDVPDGLEVDSVSGFPTRTIMVLKGKTSPETRLSTEDLQVL
uniref:CIDE-N domain-containing protein n=1 Tax=Periophthalmus magnuspinnatus TaxID=409849 RepID=A0A3B4BG96_9GOBI